ncbi:uncharacterized protein METZ01_LOCUS485873, partial [marine metagenome]
KCSGTGAYESCVLYRLKPFYGLYRFTQRACCIPLYKIFLPEDLNP